MGRALRHRYCGRARVRAHSGRNSLLRLRARAHSHAVRICANGKASWPSGGSRCSRHVVDIRRRSADTSPRSSRQSSPLPRPCFSLEGACGRRSSSLQGRWFRFWLDLADNGRRCFASARNAKQSRMRPEIGAQGSEVGRNRCKRLGFRRGDRLCKRRACPADAESPKVGFLDKLRDDRAHFRRNPSLARKVFGIPRNKSFKRNRKNSFINPALLSIGRSCRSCAETRRTYAAPRTSQTQEWHGPAPSHPQFPHRRNRDQRRYGCGIEIFGLARRATLTLPPVRLALVAI